MVSTRQMTGATSDESSLHVLRVAPSSSSPSCSSSSVSSSSNVGSLIGSGSNSHKVATTTVSGVLQHNNQLSVAPAPGAAGLASASFSNLAAAILPTAMSPNAQVQCPRQDINLMDLPAELLGHIFSFVGFKKIAHMRVISHQMNQVCSSILNSTFHRLQNQMHNRFQNVKAKMPRRESARRNHPLACECDILETCYMRLSLLQMTFGKHIERKHCCFFPGAILDEVYSVLSYIRTSPSLDRPFKVTDELFDLSTMAMEYFKEHIEPNLPDIAYFTNSTKSFAVLETSSSALSRDTSHSNSSSPPQSNMVLRKGIRKIKQGMKRYNNQLTVLRSELRTCKRKATEQAKTITEQQKLLTEHQKQTLEFANRLDDSDKKNEELSRKFSTVLQELNKCKTELQYWRSNSPANATNGDGKVLALAELDEFANQTYDTTTDDIALLGLDEHDVLLGTISNRIQEKEAQSQTSDRSNSLILLSPAPKARPTLTAANQSSPQPQILLKSGQKRKLEEQAVAGCTVDSDDPRSNNKAVQLDGSTCLNPPFASASLAASYSSSALATTGGNIVPLAVSTVVNSCDVQLALPKSNAAQQHAKEYLPSDLPVAAFVDAVDASRYSVDTVRPTGANECDKVLNFVITESSPNLPVASVSSTQNPVATLSNDVLHRRNCVSLSEDSGINNSSNSSNSKTCNTSDDNIYHNKKLRRVQNKARSQNTKTINHKSLANTHTKATRSKQSDKQTEGKM